jgi:hypothetical protein
MLATTLRPRDLIQSRVLLALLVGLGCWLAVSRVRPAGAFAEWCWDDPMVSINGVQFHTSVGAQASPADLHRAVSKTTITYYLPQGVSGQLITPNATYLHEHVQFQHLPQSWTPGTPIPITVVVQFQTNHNFAAAVRSDIHHVVLSESHGQMFTGITDSFTLAP